MRVGINAGWLGTGVGGVETYVRNLINGLTSVDDATTYVLLSTRPLPHDLLPNQRRIQQVRVPTPSGRIHLPFAFSRAVARANLDVFHEQTSAPFLFGAPFVVTIHDLYHEHFPHHLSSTDLARRRIFMALTAHRAGAVITDSAFSRRDIIDRLHVSDEGVVVAYLAPDPMFRPVQHAARLAQVRTRYGTGERFLLFVGALKPNKNLRRVVEAYVRLRSADAIRHRLVLVGAKAAWLREDIFAPARAAGLMEEVVCTGHVPEQDLVALYNAAEVFVHPSLFEGFGLPPLEAMACGTPVVTSNTTSLPEVVGDAAIMVDPLDVEALAAAIARVATDEQLRERLAARGLERAASFSWDKTARIVLGVYHDMAQRVSQ